VGLWGIGGANGRDMNTGGIKRGRGGVEESQLRNKRNSETTWKGEEPIKLGETLRGKKCYSKL